MSFLKILSCIISIGVDGISLLAVSPWVSRELFVGFKRDARRQTTILGHTLTHSPILHSGTYGFGWGVVTNHLPDAPSAVVFFCFHYPAAPDVVFFALKQPGVENPKHQFPGCLMVRGWVPLKASGAEILV